MKTIALRFSDNFAPPAGTIAEHRKYIKRNGYVWYGKLGSAVSEKVCKEIMANREPKILLIHSGRYSRYWASIDKVIKNTPPLEEFPEYYRDKAGNISTWFRVKKIEDASKGVMAACTVVSSGALLSMASKSSMSPYFIIEYSEPKELK